MFFIYFVLSSADGAMARNYQNVRSDAQVLVFGQEFFFSPVAYRTSEGRLFWDTMYLLDDLKALNVGEMSNWKIHNNMKQMVSSGEFGLATTDLHVRGDQRRSPSAVLARIVASMIQLKMHLF